MVWNLRQNTMNQSAVEAAMKNYSNAVQPYANGVTKFGVILRLAPLLLLCPKDIAVWCPGEGGAFLTS